MAGPLRLLTTSAALSLALAASAAGQTAQQPPAPRKPAAAKSKSAPKPTDAAAPAPAPAPEPPPPPPSDLKVVTSFGQGAQVSQNVTYIKGSRQRVEFPGLISIDQCDQQRTVLLNPAAKRYRLQPYTSTPQETGSAGNQAPPPVGMTGQAPRGGVVLYTTTVTDTLERQQLFGLEARRIKIVLTKQSDANACDKSPMKTETDAWYVDLPNPATACAKPPVHRPEAQAPSAGECRDRVETRLVGDAKIGFPVKSVVTTTTGDGEKDKHETTNTIEVTGLEVTRLDAALFDIPTDYAEASSSAELMPTLASGGSLQDVLFGSTADGTGNAAPKKAGVVRIGVLEPIDKSGRGLNTKLLRQELAGKFSNRPYEALPLAGSSGATIEADAKRLECDYLLVAQIDEVKTSKQNKVGGLLKAASGGGPPKDIQDVKASYQLFAIGSTSAPKFTGDIKASNGGGFGVGSALRLASFAGQMYMGMGMMRGIGGLGSLGLGLDPMTAMAATGNLGPMASSYFDPRAMAMSSMALNMSVGGLGGMTPGASDGPVYQTVGDAFDGISKAAMTKIGSTK